jgi:pyridoxamine 5'-phosphate oxidase
MDAFNPEEHTGPGLEEAKIDRNPFRQFRVWLDEALAANLPQPLAMTVATVSASRKPSARMVLLRDFDERGFVFYTNYESHKGRELEANPWAALVLYWAELDRQVRVEGRTERVSAEESNAYFQSRPRGSQLGALASPQSQVIPDREFLEQRMKDLVARHLTGPVPRPAHWGGYRVIPDSIEFWQGRPNRLHDRLRYRRGTHGDWVIERLAP